MLEESRKNVYKHIDEHIHDHIVKIQEFLRQPSVSPENYGIRECAELLKNYLEDVGCDEARLVETKGNPVVYGDYDAHAERTLVLYGMYDTMPVTGEKWASPPFEANIVNIPALGKCVVARGAINSKGPLVAFLNALKSIKAVARELPVNIRFVIEGEEELGSVHLVDFVSENVDKLKGADAMLFPVPFHPPGSARVYLGAKGVVHLELECSGEYWGRGPTQFDIHSYHKPYVDSPVWRLIHALATMTENDGNKISIDGFYDNIVGPTEEEYRLIEKASETFDEEDLKNIVKVDKFLDDTQGKDILLKMSYDPTFNINGIWAGYTGPQEKTVLPHKAACRIDVRIVPRQEPEDIVKKVRTHLDKHGYPDIQLKWRITPVSHWSKTNLNEDIVQAVIRAYRKFGYEPEILPVLPGGVPIYPFNGTPLYLPCVQGGLGHGGRAHSPDEYFVVEGTGKVPGLATCEKSYVAILYEFVSAKAR